MNNIVYAFIKELKEQHVTLRINNIDETVKLTEENRQFIFGAIQQGTFIVPFNQESHEIVMDKPRCISIFICSNFLRNSISDHIGCLCNYIN